MLLGKRPHQLIGKFSQFLLSGGRTAVDSASPRSPMDMTRNLQPAKGPKSFDLGGVGLGIVAALDKPGLQVLPKYAVLNLNRTGPNPVHSVNRSVNEDEDEDFTFVTFRVPNMTITKVYYDAGEGGIMNHGGGGFNDVMNANTTNNNMNMNMNVVGFGIFPPTQALVEAGPSFPTSYFLSSCLLCRKNLYGKDIYMYRGEKAFCSSECRSSQIMMEEWKEQCALEASRSRELSSSPYAKDQMFSTGILAI